MSIHRTALTHNNREKWHLDLLTYPWKAALVALITLYLYPCRTAFWPVVKSFLPVQLNKKCTAYETFIGALSIATPIWLTFPDGRVFGPWDHVQNIRSQFNSMCWCPLVFDSNCQIGHFSNWDSNRGYWEQGSKV